MTISASRYHALAFAFSVIFTIVTGASQAFAQKDKALSASLSGVDMTTFGRIILKLDRLPKYEIKINNGILIWRFEQEIDARADRLQSELTSYIAGARLDPDRKALRIALQQPVSFNIQDAGTDLYLDLLPKGWKGPNPSLPADIVHDLSRRAREAEEALKALQKIPARPLHVEVANSKSLTLIRLYPLDPAQSKVIGQSGRIRVLLNGNYHIETPQWMQALPTGIKLENISDASNQLDLQIQFDPSVQSRSYFDDQTLVLEFARQKSGMLSPDSIDEDVTTGSVDNAELDISTQSKQSDRNILVRMQKSADDPAILIQSDDDMPRAIFVSDDKAFVVLETDRTFDLTEAKADMPREFSQLDPIASGQTKVLMIGLKEQRFPVIEANRSGFVVSFRLKPDPGFGQLDMVSQSDQRDSNRLMITLADASKILSFDDPDSGHRYLVAPSRTSNIGFLGPMRYPEFVIAASAQGVAIRPLADDLDLHTDVGIVRIERSSGHLNISGPDAISEATSGQSSVILRSSFFRRLPDGSVLSEIRRGIDAINQADPQLRVTARLKLARLYAAHDLYTEAAAMMELAASERNPGNVELRDELERAFYLSLSGRHVEQQSLYLRKDVDVYPEAALFLAYDLASLGKFEDAMAAFRRTQSVLAYYPRFLVRMILPVLAEAAIEAEDYTSASNLVPALQSYIQAEDADQVRYVSAKLMERTGRADEAVKQYRALISSFDPRVRVKANQALLASEFEMQRLSDVERLAIYEGLSTLWRGDWIEARSLIGVAGNALRSADWRRGFMALRRLNFSYSDVPGVRTLLDTATTEIESLFDGENEGKIGSVEAVALFMDFREFSPVGRRGDDVIRKLADRLVELDLLPQAAELMRYQLTYRLEGLAKASAAPKLAYILLLDRKPKDALQILADTRMNGMADTLQRSRLLLDARAHADLGDVEGALELVSQLQGDDVDRLRAEISWRARDWQRAAEYSERVIGERWRDGQPWQDDLALYALRSAIGYALADDRLALDRLRGRFASRLTDRPEAPAFRFLTAPLAKRAPLTSEYAQSFPGGSAIDGFMTFYRDRYLKPLQPAKSNDTASGQKSG